MTDNELARFEAELAAQVEVWEVGLRSGYSVRQIFDATVENAAPLLAEEMKRVLDDVDGGSALPDALRRWLERRPSEDLNLVVTTLLVQREVGGNLADILQVVGHLLRKRQANG